MALTLFLSVAGERYALPCATVVEVVPSVPLRPVARAPDWLAGVFLYRGNVIGVVDLGRLLVGVPCRLQLSSRIVVLRGSNDARFGLLAERVTEARTLDLTTLAQPPVRGSLCVSGTVVDAGHLVHVLDPRAILPSSSPAWQEGGVPA